MGLRVLIVEDERDLREAITEVLAEAGHACITAEDVASARARLDDTIDVVLVDLHLPDHPAETLLGELAARRIPAVLTSADATKNAYAVAARWSLPLLAKPFDLDALLMMVERASSAP